jgi:hypothetical protein
VRLACVQPTVSSGQGGPGVPVFEPSWRDDVMIVTSPPLGAVVAFDEGLARPVTMEVGSECHTVRSARHGLRSVQGAHFLGCTCLRATVGSPLCCDGRFVR